MNYKSTVCDLIATSKPDGLVTKLRHMPDIWQDITLYTQELNPKNGSERIYAYSKEIKTQPLCKCGKELSFVSITEGYREFCNDRRCEYARKTATERRVEVLKNNGGIGLSNPASKLKAMATLQEKHGDDVINPGQIKTFKEKMRVDNPMFNIENVLKISKTIEERYGQGKYNPMHIPYNKLQCSLLFDSVNFTKICKGKSSIQIGTEYDLSSNLILKYARKYNVLDTMVFNHRSEMEHDLKLWLINNNIPFKHDDRTVLNGLELDFLFKDNNFAIELNGIFHHSEIGGKKSRSYHKHKFDMCDESGIQLIQVWQDEYWKSKNVIQSKILYLAGMHSNKIHARKCKIDFIEDTVVERDFLNKNHIQGFAAYRQLSVAAWYDDNLIGIMCFAYQNDYWDLIRFSTDIKIQSTGLFSKMLSFVQKSGKITGRVVSFSDNRISNGKLYQSSGFTLETSIGPDYSYTNDYTTREHKQQFRKNNLIKRFSLDPTYVKNTTEWEIVQELGYDRIWDAGKKRWSISI